MRIALCLHGLSGNINNFGNGISLDQKYAYKHYQKHILDINKNVDIFMHSWSVNDKYTLINLYNPINYLFEEQEYFNRSKKYIESDKGLFSLESRVNSIIRCLKLVKQEEITNNFKYDYIMVTRFDVALLTDIIFEKLPLNRFIISHWNDRGNTNNHLDGIYDMWFISNSDILYNYFIECNKKYDLIPNTHPHIHWRLIINKLNIKPIYYLFVGKDFELVRRLYYDGHGRNKSYPDISNNLKNYYLNYSN